MNKAFDLKGIEEKLPSTELKGKETIELRTDEMKAYAEACLKIKNLVKEQRPEVVLCNVPESYAIGKILHAAGVMGIKMFPAITNDNRDAAYNSISSIVEHQEANHLSVAFIDCRHNFTMTPLGFLITSIEDEIARNCWNEYSLMFSALRMSKRDRDFKGEGEQKIGAVNENEQRAILYEYTMLNDFAVPNLFSCPELVGAKYDKGVARAKNSARIFLYDNDRKHDMGERDSHEFFVKSIVNQLKGG